MENINVIIKGPFLFKDILYKKDPLFNEAGVYLWTLPHKNNLDPVYVGEAKNFKVRFDHHNQSFNNHTEYLVFPDSNDHLYTLLGGEKKEFYYQLYRSKKFWYDTLTNNPEPWVSEYSKLYRDKLEIFLLVSDKTERDKLNRTESKSLQTQIQRSLRYEHKIKYYTGDNQSWLGKEDLVSNNQYLEPTFNLVNIPATLDVKSANILNRLYEYAKKYPFILKK